MVKPMKIVVTNKTDFKMYNALNLGDVMHFDGFGIYTYPNGKAGTYDQWWLDAMLKSGAFVDVTEDDPLPPVPDSVMYNAGQGCRLEVATLPPNANYEARVRIGVFSNTLVYQGKCTCLEPDEALQLAHDLRRMAMQIKRNQKQEQAQ